MAVFIYGLVCPNSGEVRYIGKSLKPKTRRGEHIRLARAGASYRAARWIRSLLQKGQEPGLVIIRQLRGDEIWQDVEREEIAIASAAGCRLTNTSRGGDGLDFRDDEHRAEVIARMSAAAVKRCATSKGRLSEIARRAWEDPGFRAAVSEGIRRANTPDARAARSKRMVEAWASDRDGLASRFRGDEIRKRRSEAAKARWANQEFRQKMSELHLSQRDRLSAASRARWDKARALKVAMGPA